MLLNEKVIHQNFFFNKKKSNQRNEYMTSKYFLWKYTTEDALQDRESQKTLGDKTKKFTSKIL